MLSTQPYLVEWAVIRWPHLIDDVHRAARTPLRLIDWCRLLDQADVCDWTPVDIAARR